MKRGEPPVEACRICGKVERLTWEHIPPKGAFNDQNFRTASMFGGGEFGEEEERGSVLQGGIGSYTLCGRCNNLTGKWYGNDYIQWCNRGAQILWSRGDRLQLAHLFPILPLRVLKQIITMSFSLNGPKYRVRNPELEDFVMNRERKYLDPRFRIFTYFNQEGVLRRIGDSIVTVNLEKSSEPRFVTELSHFPYGYVMTEDGSNPDPRLQEITHWSRYGYFDFRMQTLALPELDTHLGYPLDYRTRDEIRADILKNELIAMQQEQLRRAS